MAEWHYSRQGQIFGPFTFEQLRDLARQRKVLPDDLVCREGDSKWTSAQDVSGLFPEPAAKPVPTPPRFRRRSAPPAQADCFRLRSLRPSGSRIRPGRRSPSRSRPSRRRQPRRDSSPCCSPCPSPSCSACSAASAASSAPAARGDPLVDPQPFRPESPPSSATGSAGLPAHLRRRQKSLPRQGGPAGGFNGPGRRGGDLHPQRSARAPGPDRPRVEDQAEVEVQIARPHSSGTDADHDPGPRPGEKPIPPVSATVNLAVEPMPPSLALAVSPRVAVDQGGRGQIHRATGAGPVQGRCSPAVPRPA